MKFFEFLEVVLRWAWGTLLTAIVTAVLTMLWKHGRRWFRGARRFIRTGRIVKGNGRGRGRRSLPAPAPVAAKEPRMTATRVLSMLAQLAGQKTPPPPAHSYPTITDVERLDLKF